MTPSSDMTTLTECVEKFKSLSIDLYATDKEDIRLKMGNLVKEMADVHGLNPRLIFGKGNVKAQRARYKKRVIEEKRFQCIKCEHAFCSSGSLKHHIDKRVCERVPSLKCPCGDSSRTPRHQASKKHKIYLSGVL